jgi:CNT family concentrative nucleoside transporter
MRFIGVIGIITLLGIAYLLSNNRKKIKSRVVIWGLLLQLLFAGIVLGTPTLSFLSMLIFLMLILLFIFKDYINRAPTIQKQISKAGIVIGFTLISVLLFYLVSKVGILGWIFSGIIVVIFVSALLKKHLYQRYLVSGMLSSGFVLLLINGTNGERMFDFLSRLVEKFLRLADYGARFLFGNLAVDKFFGPADTWPGFGFQFAFTALPVIIFFASFMSILYHLGLMQKIIQWMARFMQWTMGTSGAETLSCAANIFVGQTEAPLLVRPFLDEMTLSELLTIMLGGFATIAGGVMAGYIRMGIHAGHLIAASVMSAPAALVVAKIIFPETEHSKTAGDVELPKNLVKSTNVLDAASRGVTDGLKLAANVAAMLIAFIALIGLVDSILSVLDRIIDGNWLNGTYTKYAIPSSFSPVNGEYSGIFPGSLKTLFGTILSPLAWLMGVSWEFAGEVGNLLGLKLVLTEFVAYGTLAELQNMAVLSEKAIVISTYALCGFANFASIGIQIGGIGALAPKRRSDLSRVALKAMFGGAIASWITASIAGILL